MPFNSKWHSDERLSSSAVLPLLKNSIWPVKVTKENRGDATFDPLIDNDFNTLFIRMRCYTILNVPLK